MMGESDRLRSLQVGVAGDNYGLIGFGKINQCELKLAELLNEIDGGITNPEG